VKTARSSNILMLVWIVYSLVLGWALWEVAPDWAAKGGADVMVFTQAAMFLVPGLLVLAVHRKNWRDILPLRWLGWKNVLMVVVLMILAQPTMMMVSALSTLFADNTVAETVGDMVSTGGLGMTLLAVGVMPSVCEEFMFRGVIRSGYKNRPVWVMVLVSGVFFGIMHMNAHQFLYTCILGCILAYMVHATRSLFAGILGHFVVNGSQVLMMFSGAEEEAVAAESLTASEAQMTAWIEANPGLAGAIMMGIVSIVTVPLFCVAIHAFREHNRKRNALADAALAVDTPMLANGDAAATGVMGGADMAADDAMSDAEIIEADKPNKRNPFDFVFWSVIAVYVALMVLTYMAQQAAV